MSRLLATSVVIIDVDAGIPTAEIERACGALTRQVLEHWAPAWGTTATVRATSSGPARPEEFALLLRKSLTVADALGYHERDVAYVSPQLCAQDGASWTSCASHEILEMLGDPLLRRMVQAPDGDLWALEVCDACEAETYSIDGVVVSDFCLPAYFEPQDNVVERYDYLGRCSLPYAITPGGYGQTFDPKTGWTQHGTMRPYRAKLAAIGIGRAAVRAARFAP